MNQQEDNSFAAVITIKSTSEQETTVLRVLLYPADKITLEEGRTKLLQDCTLAELQQFAESLEKKLFDQHGSDSLIDLVVSGEAEIEFQVANDGVGDFQTADLWLEHAIFFPDQQKEEEVLPPELDKYIPGVEVESDLAPPHGDIGEMDDPDTHIPDTEEVVEETVATEPSSQPIETEIEVESPEPDGFEETGELLESPVVNEIGAELDAQVDTLTADEEEPAKAEPAGVAEELQIGKRILGLRRPLDHPTWTAVDILANESAFRDAQAHALSSLNKEVAGVLIGPQPEKQPDGRYVVHVADTLIAKYTRMHGASVTYTPESWRYVNDRLEEMYPDGTAVIVGWYHTHPGFGIFLSGMDLFIHQNFFTQQWHIALVLDPLSKRSGFFCWDREMSRVDSYDFPWPKWASGSW